MRWAIALVLSACLIGQPARAGEPAISTNTDALLAMSDRLLLLQSDLEQDDSSRLDTFLQDSRAGRYPPGIYLAVLRKQSLQLDDAQLREDLELAISAGVANAAILYSALPRGLPDTRERSTAHQTQAAYLLSQFAPEESWLIPMTSYLAKKRGSGPGPLADQEFASQLYRSAATGTPIGNSWLLRVYGQSRKLSAMACGFLTIAKVRPREFSCGESDRQYILFLESIVASRARQLEKEYAGHYEFYRNALCDRLSGSMNSPSVCNDLLSTALSFCRLRIDATRKALAPVSGLFVCNRRSLQAAGDIVEGTYEELFHIPIFKSDGN